MRAEVARIVAGAGPKPGDRVMGHITDAREVSGACGEQRAICLAALASTHHARGAQSGGTGRREEAPRLQQKEPI
jgi:hypothetical protein